MDTNEFLGYLRRSTATTSLADSLAELVETRRMSAAGRAVATRRAALVEVSSDRRARVAS